MAIKMLKGKKVYHTTGIPKPKFTLPEKVEKSKLICDLYATGRYTVEDACKRYKVSHKAFLRWAAPSSDIESMLVENRELPNGCVPDIHYMYNEAKKLNLKSYTDNVRDSARNSLLKKIEGYKTEEVVEEYELDKEPKDSEGNPNINFGKMILVKRKVKQQEVVASDTAIIFALTNVDSDNFKNRNLIQAEVNTKTEEKAIDRYTDEELAAKKLELRRRLRVAEAEDIDYEEVNKKPKK